MLTIKASARPSKIHGIGLFADEKILKGTVTWKFNSRFDILFEAKEIESMSFEQRNFILRYSFLSIKQPNKYVFSIRR